MPNDDARQFWDLYFRNRFVRLERRDRVYRGLALADAAAPGPANLLHEPATRPLEIAFERLSGHDYASDGRFSRLLERPRLMSQAFQHVLRDTYPYRDPAPFGRQRMMELLEWVRFGFGLRLEDDGAQAEVERTVSRMVLGYASEFAQPLAALVWLLGEMRERSSTAALMAVIRSSPYVAFAAAELESTIVNAAFSALWKVNDKTMLADLLALMAEASATGRHKMAALLERLVSREELLGADRCEERYADPAAWRNLLAPSLGFGHAEWDRYDAGSLFWEIRYLAALRLSPADKPELALLARDEVATVRNAALARLRPAG